MESRVVLITGALTGIGRSTALAFAREGARVNRVPCVGPGVFITGVTIAVDGGKTAL